MADDARGAPLPWIVQWAGLVASRSTVLDVAAGGGRHALFFAERGHKVVAVDRDTSRLPGHPNIEALTADLEDGSPWPLSRRFGAVVVTNYLHRPLMPALLDAIEPGGVLLYQTFMDGQQRFGRPTNPAHLLRDGELLELVRGAFSVTAYEARLITDPAAGMSMVQRVAARRL
ncbi:MAG: class I SAM-dependent methyltransferase [Proteobacteria bacterium]|nr:class I SAM-dependent methyltransferase [Pseudomonadota bacterium]